MRTISQIEKDLTYNRAIRDAENLGDSLDNDGRVAHTAGQRRAIAHNRVRELEAELVTMRRIVARPRA